MAALTAQFAGVAVTARVTKSHAKRNLAVRAGKYDDELLETATKMTMPGKGILAMDESNATCGGRLEGVGVENIEENRRRYRELLITAPNLGEHIGGAILFEETLYQSCSDGTSFVDALKAQGIYPGIKVDKGLRPLANSNGESWCQGMDDLADRAAAYYEQGARFCKWRSVVSIPQGPSKIAVRDCAYGLARYAAVCQNAGLVPIVEPEILLDGDHDIERNFEVAAAAAAVSVTTSVKAPPSGFGSFHQQYRIDGRLVAVGVVDVLPLCMSSKYCFWEPSLKALALGKLSSLREMDWVREASTHCPTLRFYYMGFYIHTCPKMRYKADYKPSELKCPVRGAWVDFDGVAKHRLNSGVFGPLATAPAAPDASTAAAREGRSAGADDGATGRAEAAASSREEEEEGEEEEETDDARTESITLGLVAGNQVVECAALARLAPGMPCAAVAALRHKLQRWRAQAGPVHEHIVYLVHIDQLGMEVAEEGDEDEDVDVEGADEDDEDEDDDDDKDDDDEEGSADMHV
eukprot:CAMPEP_0181349580 /NCGR_PEP_ID=MMETSP1106-20121128/803_1 /TAXON_ID=81844 /ORGANISM="Mantoniella antarctica, Strain SL-175" /LENGTH=521 /DNA_ID=CAMNT_0023461985 /DNA_START=46 /DNA_END=1610 /DNA_ORIENTATION=+